jgi:antitoxin component YwqK of YwqJK toxin-antitoxin module
MINQLDENGLRHGLWEHYWRDGRLMYKCRFKNGKRSGLWECYYDNGQVYSKGEYKDEKKRGLSYKKQYNK